MNVNPFSKKSAAVAKPVKGASPLNDIGDVSTVTEMFQRLRQQNAQYDQAIAIASTKDFFMFLSSSEIY